MLGKVDAWLERLLARRCVLCGLRSAGFSVCRGCAEDLPWIRHGCRGCGLPIAPAAPPDYCACCARGPSGVETRAALVYEYPVDCLVMAAKFQRRQECAYALGELLARFLGEFCPVRRPDLLVPVPLHARRLGERGFNQADEIAAPVGRLLGRPVAAGACRRVRDTPEQSGLTANARRNNMRGAFRASRELRNRQVAIIDDVLTTGSTIAAMTHALQEAGVADTQVWVAARAVA